MIPYQHTREMRTPAVSCENSVGRLPDGLDNKMNVSKLDATARQ